MEVLPYWFWKPVAMIEVDKRDIRILDGKLLAAYRSG